MSENDKEPTVNIKAIVNRLKPLVIRTVDGTGQPLTSLGDDADAESGAGSGAFQTLKNVLSAQYADAATAELEIGTMNAIAPRCAKRRYTGWPKFTILWCQISHGYHALKS